MFSLSNDNSTTLPTCTKLAKLAVARKTNFVKLAKLEFAQVLNIFIIITQLVLTKLALAKLALTKLTLKKLALAKLALA